MLKKSLPLWVRVTEREPSINRNAESPQAIRKKLDALRRQKFALFNGTPKMTRRANSLFSDVSPKEDHDSARHQHNESFGRKAPEESQWSNKGRGALDDADGYQPAKKAWLDPRSPEARAQRQAKLEEYLTANGKQKSTLDITAGGEDDMDLGGLPPEQFHGTVQGGMTVAEDSALNRAVLSRDPRLDKSRLGKSTWGLSTTTNNFSTRPEGTTAAAGAGAGETRKRGEPTQQEMAEQQHGGGGYSNVFPADANLEDQGEHHQRSVSIYTKKKLYVEGLCGYNDVVSEHEERELCNELLQLLLHPSVEYQAEECRYSCNIFERKLGVTPDQQLAFSFDDAPVLRSILRRFHLAGMIPALPNTAQVNEFCGPFAGYPPHRKNQHFGPFYGILNMLSPCLLSLQHEYCPWSPKFYGLQRSLFTVQQPCLSEYKVGTANRNREYNAFRFRSRMTRDYRLEVLFATVDVPQVKTLRDSLAMTEYAEQRRSMLPQLTVGSSRSNTITPSSSDQSDRQRVSAGESNDTDDDAADSRLSSGLRPEENALLRELKAQTTLVPDGGRSRRAYKSFSTKSPSENK